MERKGLICLRIAALPGGSADRTRLYADACRLFSEKAVIRKMERLSDKDYIEYGVSARTGWLTEKGRLTLAREG